MGGPMRGNKTSIGGSSTFHDCELVGGENGDEGMVLTYPHPPPHPKNSGERKIVKGRRRKNYSETVTEEINRKRI